MGIDIHSAITISAVLALLMGIGLSYVLRDYPVALRPSLRAWILGTLLQPVAWVLYSARGQVTDWIAIVLANALLGLSYALLVRGLRLFAGCPAANARVFAPVLLIALAAIMFTYAMPSMRWRTVSISALLAVQFANGSTSLLDRSRQLRRSDVLTMIAFALTAAVLLVRTLYEGLRSETLTSAFAPTPMQAAVFGIAAFLPVLSTFGFVLMCNDRLNQELVRQAMLDPLTGICNRRALVQAAERMLASARRHAHPVAALLVDADHFKRINDEHGHAAGDAALQAIVAALQLGLREEDLLGRLGGEEFVVLLPDADEAAARVAAERLRHSVESSPIAIEGSLISLRVSIGIAMALPGGDFSGLLRRADQALYCAKLAGRNCVVGPGDELPQVQPTPQQSASGYSASTTAQGAQ